MKMIIYKITNRVNQKIYIGQTCQPMKNRFYRHIRDSINNSNTLIHLHRAIRKYGKENFYIEQIDEAKTKEELNQKEKYWIKYYQSNIIGYNSTIGGEGGNTYQNKTQSELNIIKAKISISNRGSHNGQAKAIKCKSIITNKEYIFDTVKDCLNFFNIKNKQIIVQRANNKDNTLYRKEWLIAWKGNSYYNFNKVNTSTRGTKVILKSKIEEYFFNSESLAINFLGIKRSQFDKALKTHTKILGYDIVLPEIVSTIGDECSQVGMR